MLTTLTTKERTARHCVCCGSDALDKTPAILMPFVAHRVFGWEPAVIDASWGLHTIPHGIAYTQCQSLLCRACGLLFLDMRFSDQEMTALYQGYRDEAYLSLRERYEPGYRDKDAQLRVALPHLHHTEALLESYLPPRPRILDWGGDTGNNTPFKDRNSLLHIYDISGVDSLPGSGQVDKQIAANTDYDLVVCSHVLEHVPYPADLLLEIRSVMRDDTLLYLEVPFEPLMQERAAGRTAPLKRHWHEHINFFSEASLLALLSACGFTLLERVQRETRHGQQVFQLVCRKQN